MLAPPSRAIWTTFRLDACKVFAHDAAFSLLGGSVAKSQQEQRSSFARWMAAVRVSEAPASQVIKDDPCRSQVRQVLVQGIRCVVKTYRMPWLKTWLYHLFRATPAWRELDAGWTLHAMGVRCAPAVALVHEVRPGREMQKLVIPWVEGPTLFSVIGQSQDALLRRRLAQGLGRQVGRMMQAGWVNRDHKPANLLVDEMAVQTGEPVVIDPLGLLPWRTRGQAFRMLAMMLRTARQAGPVSLREAMRCLREVCRECPGLGPNPAAVARRLAERA